MGLWKGKPYNIELKPNSKPYHSKPFSIPKLYENTLKLEVTKINNSEWAAPTFIMPKKDGTVRFISDFREFNKKLSKDLTQYPKYKIYC